LAGKPPQYFTKPPSPTQLPGRKMSTSRKCGNAVAGQ